MKYLTSLASMLSVCLGATMTFAGYVQLNVADRKDYAFDGNGILYISTQGGSVLRYDSGAGSFLSPFAIGGTLGGIDLSPNGQTLAVADYTTQGTSNRIHLVDVSTGNDTMVSFARQSSESGTYMVAWGANNRVLVASNFAGSGWTPLRSYDPQTGQTTTLASIRQSSMLAASADRTTIGIAEANISSGPISDFDVSSQAIQGTVKTTWFTFEVAVDRDGDKFVVPTYGGTFVYDKTGNTFQEQGKIGQYANHGPIAAVFSPVNDVFFTAEWSWNGPEHGVRVYNANTLALIATIDPYPFGWTGNGAMGAGRMEISPDGRMLAVSINGGLRLYDVSVFVPEPSSVVLLLTGGTALLWQLRRRTHCPIGRESAPCELSPESR